MSDTQILLEECHDYLAMSDSELAGLGLNRLALEAQLEELRAEYATERAAENSYLSGTSAYCGI